MAALVVSPPRPAVPVKTEVKLTPSVLSPPGNIPPVAAPALIVMPAAKPSEATTISVPHSPQKPSAPAPPGKTKGASGADAEHGNAMAPPETVLHKPGARAAAKPHHAAHPAATHPGASAEESSKGGAAAKKDSGRTDVVLKMKEPPAEMTPASHKRLAASGSAAGMAASSASTLPSAASHVDAARGAVTPPKQEDDAKAANDLVAALGQRPKPSPEIEELCKKIYAIITSKTPDDEESIVATDPEKMAADAGNQLKGNVQGDVGKVGQSYAPLDQKPAGAPAQPGQPISDPGAAAPTSPIGAANDAPDPIPPGNASLDADAADAKTQRADAGMDTEPAKLAKSGPVADAREAQGELDQTAKEDPAKIIAQQQATLAKASADMAALQKSAVDALSSARKSTTTHSGSEQHKMVGSETSMRQEASQQVQAIFDDTQTKVKALLQPLPQTAMQKWDAGVAISSRKFKQALKQVEDWIKERHSGVGGSIVGLWDDVTGLPDWVTDRYNEAEREFGNDICDLARGISTDVNGVIMACEALIADARARINDIFAKLPSNLQTWAAGEQAKFGQQLDGLAQQAHQVQANFTHDLVKTASQSFQDARDQLHVLREKAKGLIGKIKDAINAFLKDPVKFIINALLELLSIPPAAFWAVVAKIQKVVKDIADDPLKFASNLLAAIGKGFSQFFDHILTHLLHGFIDWLTGGLASAGVTLPKDASVKSIVTFILQLMGITWPRIRKLLAKHIGEENVALIEKAYSIVANLIALGPEGVFEMIKQKLDPATIMQQVIKAAVDYMMKAVIKAVAARIIMLFNPVGAILEAIEAIYRVLKWIFVNAARIFRLVETVVNMIADIMAGNIGGVANMVEGALEQLVAPVIDFLADYLGFGDLPDKVKDTILALQEWVEGILDEVIGWIVEKGKALLKAIGLGGESEDKDKDKAKDKGQVGKKVSWVAGGESHSLWIAKQGLGIAILVASEPKPAGERLDDYQVLADSLEGEKGTQAKGLIAQARQLLAELDQNAEKMAVDVANPEQKPEQTQAKEGEVENAEDKLAKLLEEIMDLLGVGPPLKDRFKAEFDKMDPLASEYCLKKLDEADEPVKKAKNWVPVRQWLLDNGLIFTQPLTRTTNFGEQRTQPKAVSGSEEAVKESARKNGFKYEDVKDTPPKIVERSRSEVNSGSPPFPLAKSILQEYGFDQRISPVLTLKNSYLESEALANELGLGEIQLHHLITEQMVDTLAAYHPSFPGRQLRDNPKYQYNSSPGGHIGYERWHRQYDAHMRSFITGVPRNALTQSQLILEIHVYYQSDHGENVTKRIPGVNLL
jgi:hypothetical protein